MNYSALLEACLSTILFLIIPGIILFSVLVKMFVKNSITKEKKKK